MSWLVLGIVFMGLGLNRHSIPGFNSSIMWHFVFYAGNFVLGVGAIGGMVVVGNMISKFGICTVIG